MHALKHFRTFAQYPLPPRFCARSFIYTTVKHDLKKRSRRHCIIFLAILDLHHSPCH